MLLLGLILLGGAGAFTGLLIADNLGGGPDYTVTVLGNGIATLNTLGAFLAGIALTLVLGLGCLLVFAGAARARQRAVELEAARMQARDASAASAPLAAPLATDATSGAEPAVPARSARFGRFGRAARPSRHRFNH